NAQVDLRNFIERYPMSGHIQEAWLAMGDYLYHYKQYQGAYDAYRHVDVDALDPESAEDFRFHAGYAAFSIKRYDEAKSYLWPLTESVGKYRVVAGYYYAYILYMEGKYQNALNEFAEIKDDPTFKALVPYYVQQIYYMQGRYRDVVAMAEELMASASPKRLPEVARLVGESYYQLGNYDRALPYMKLYFERSAQRPDKDGDYILGYIYYKLQVYDTASHYFLRVLSVDKNSELAQSAYYHLGYCYVQRGEKKFAMDAFRDAARLAFNPVVQEDAMYHYARLSYELGVAPYKESVTVFTDFLEAYPQSAYSRKIYEYMLSAYSRNRHYAEALAAVEKLQPLSYELKQVKQNLLFNRGMEAFQSRRYDLAETSFVAAGQEIPEDVLAARALFWAAESAWQLDGADSALRRYEAFMLRPDAVSAPEYAMGYYNLGYLYMDRIRYAQALTQWERFFTVCRGADTVYLTDACLRAGDCEFMLRHFEKAEAYYTEVIRKGREPLDYAYYQRALCKGAQGRYQDKADGLLWLIENYPRTAYMSMAIN
ncbi:MAG: tetratricopeptide repeat protein, partial [Bacteroidales bacterium]|nr:tetratricopeptide repeat protein [Bacteroidales bacterium]